MLRELEQPIKKAGISQSKLDDVDELIKDSIKRGVYSSAVYLVAKDGEIVQHTAFGYLDKDSRRRETQIDSVFDLLSVTKSVATASCAMKLVEEGNLDLDTKVASILKPFSEGESKSLVRMRHLLTMSSGLPFDVQEYREKYSDVSDLWKALMSQPALEFDPGSKISYSDLGYRLLGKLLEEVSGRQLDKLAKDKFFDPLGMKDTTYNPGELLKPRCAQTDYSLVRKRNLVGEVDDELDFALGGAVGCDGLFSTARDLATYMQTLLNDGRFGNKQLFDPRSVKLMTTDQMVSLPYERKLPTITQTFMTMMRGMGFELKLDNEMSYMGNLFSSRAFGKFGGTGTFIVADPQTDVNVVFLTNKGWPGLSDLLGFEKWFEELRVREFFDLVNSAISR